MVPFIERLYCRSRLYAHLWRAWANKVFPDFVKYFPPSPLILEIGTGQGLGAIFLSERLKDSRFIAVDNDFGMIKAAAENVKRRGLQDRIGVEWGDALNLNFPDKSFDAAVAITVLHHVPHYENAIAEAARVLKQGGVLLIADFDFKASIFPKFEVLFGHPESIFSWSEVSEAVRNAGFKTLKVKFYGMGMFVSASAKL